MADEDPEERRHPPAFKQQLTKDMMNATGMLQEQAKSFLKTYDWNLEAALHGYQQRLLEPGARARLAARLGARRARGRSGRARRAPRRQKIPQKKNKKIPHNWRQKITQKIKETHHFKRWEKKTPSHPPQKIE